MDIKKLSLFFEEVNSLMAENTKLGFEFFIEEWPKLDNDDRRILAPILGVNIGTHIAEENISIEDRLHWAAIAHFADRMVANGKFIEDEDNQIFPRLTLDSDIYGNQITLIFRDLKAKGVITSTDELIAEAISIIFPIEQSTAYKDLTEPKRTQKVTKLI